MEESKEKQVTNRNSKSSAFTTYFSDPVNAAQLYSALAGIPVAPEDIHFTTLEGVLFVARKNDMAFTVKNKVLMISEHQSTINKNMPLRSIIYYGRTIERLVNPKALYREKQVPIPTPEFYVFYNGNEPYPAEDILKLSSAYLEKNDTPMLELIVKVININLPMKHELLQKCRPMYEYSWFIQKIKEYMGKEKDRDAAIVSAIRDCEKEGIMVDFVRKHGSEAINMLFTQWNFEDAMEVRYEEGFEDGLESGTEKGDMLRLIQQVCRKMQKGKSVEIIAEELEEEIAVIEKVCHAAEASGTNQDAEKVYETLQTFS